MNCATFVLVTFRYCFYWNTLYIYMYIYIYIYIYIYLINIYLSILWIPLGAWRYAPHLIRLTCFNKILAPSTDIINGWLKTCHLSYFIQPCYIVIIIVQKAIQRHKMAVQWVLISVLKTSVIGSVADTSTLHW